MEMAAHTLKVVAENRELIKVSFLPKIFTSLHDQEEELATFF